jgi:hypothetical protein
MIHVEFKPSLLRGKDAQWWKAWRSRANRATQKAIRDFVDGKQIGFDPDIWTDLKNWLLEVKFHGKCAYCETHLRGARQHPDAEHYRPKAGVTVTKLTGVSEVPRVVCPDGVTRDHIGYFWLAYDWHNLLPSCNLCNRAPGKAQQFPVQLHHAFLVVVPRRGPRSRTAQKTPWGLGNFPSTKSLDAIEHPLLLHPYRDDPGEHLCFGVQGIVGPRAKPGGTKSSLGHESIRVFGLDDDALQKRRHKEQHAAWMDYLVALTSGGDERKVLGPYYDGTAEYSAAVVQFVDRELKKANARMQALRRRSGHTSHKTPR